MSYHADDYLHEQETDERILMVSQAVANTLLYQITALSDLIKLSDKHGDLTMLNIIKKHLAAMQREVQKELQARR